MDLEKLIERVVGELRERAVAASVLLTVPASDVLRAAFVEVRRAAMTEMDQAISKHIEGLPSDRKDLAAYGARECWFGRRALLPPAAEGSGE